MTITAKIIADSVSPQGVRLTTMQLRYPKFIHGEAKTHRVIHIGDAAYESLQEVGFMDYPEFSRNTSSSRAIPVTRLIQDVIDDPVIPVWWGRNQPGMQAAEELVDGYRQEAIDQWLNARDDAVLRAKMMHQLGVHKQIVNRIIEPWCHINVVCTATDYENFFALRRHSGAQPEMRVLADAMWDARGKSVPKLLNHGEWHLPYITDDEKRSSGPGFDNAHGTLSIMDWRCLIKLCVARCARVSYLTHDFRTPDVGEDLKLYDRLVGSEPLHASPCEHQATPDPLDGRDQKYLWGNLTGWWQYRKMLPNENMEPRR